MDTPESVGAEWAFGEDADHPGRWFAELRWDDHEHKCHQSIKAVNEPSIEAARATALDEYRHTIERPDLHWPYEA